MEQRHAADLAKASTAASCGEYSAAAGVGYLAEADSAPVWEALGGVSEVEAWPPGWPELSGELRPTVSAADDADGGTIVGETAECRRHTQQDAAIDARAERSVASSSSDLSPTIDNLDALSTFDNLAQTVIAAPAPTPETYNIRETLQSTVGPLTTEISQAAPAGQGPSHCNQIKPPTKHDSDKSLNVSWTTEAGDAVMRARDTGVIENEVEKIETADGLRAIGAGLNNIAEAFKNAKRKDDMEPNREILQSLREVTETMKAQTQAFHLLLQHLARGSNSNCN
ncbi:unnamed protein product [Phytophthora fragariaefolia]|uniref:Unnamed protein product n=1 Tax=Phytophthora fragariaefolia TaxID=1490495 RepID=A0A9W7DAM2_9STRA|nr:unnamed protein product [Phytophthora fragariaefolia]